jgi:hypothetical protein
MLMLLLSTAGVLLSGPNHTNGSMAVSGAPTFNVLTYGAVGDGVTVDSVAVRTTFAACKEAGGGTVLFPAHRSYVTGPVNGLRHQFSLEVCLEKHAYSTAGVALSRTSKHTSWVAAIAGGGQP